MVMVLGIVCAVSWLLGGLMFVVGVQSAMQETSALVLVLNGTVAGTGAAVLSVLEDVRAAVKPAPKSSILDASPSPTGG